MANYQAAQTVKAVWAQASAAFEAVQDNLPALAEGVNSAAASLRQTAQQISAAMSATGGQIDLSGLLQLTSGLSQLAQSYSAFHEGLVSYAGGVDALSANWSSVYSGISSLASGAGELSDGVAALDEETSKIPELIDELTGGSAEDESADASAQASFLDGRNGDTASVQFVIMTEGISEPERGRARPRRGGTGLLRRALGPHRRPLHLSGQRPRGNCAARRSTGKFADTYNRKPARLSASRVLSYST